MWALQRLADPDNDKKGDDQRLSNSTKQDTWTINFSFTATREYQHPPASTDGEAEAHGGQLLDQDHNPGCEHKLGLQKGAWATYSALSVSQQARQGWGIEWARPSPGNGIKAINSSLETPLRVTHH